MKTSSDQIEFQNQLLAAESTNSALRADYERKLNAMLETQLSAGKKLWFFAVLCFAIAMIGIVGTLLLTEKLPLRAQVGLGVGILFAVSWIVFLARMLRRGVMRKKIDPPLAAVMGFAFALIMCILMAVGGMPAETVTLNAVLFLIPAGLMVMRTVIEQSELRTQERLTELQYKIAVLSERIGDDDASGAPVRR
jgi:hypothetical protein